MKQIPTLLHAIVFSSAKVFLRALVLTAVWTKVETKARLPAKAFLPALIYLAGATAGLLAQPNLATSDDNSPAVIAKNFSAVYGVRADAVEAILKIYEKDGLDPAQRKSRTESLLKKYQQAPEKKSRAPLLSDASKKDLDLSPALADVLDWDLYAGSKYLTTTGYQSPAVVASGDVNIWYGIPPKALRALAAKLEEDKAAFEDFQKKLDKQVERFKELEKELSTRADYDAVAKQAQQLLNEGKIAEAEKLLEDDFEQSEKRLAYKAYELGTVKELALKYAEAAKYLQKAVGLDPNNSAYLLAFGNIENTNGHYDMAIEYWQKALAIDTVAFKNQPEKAAILYNNLGAAWVSKGEYDRAIVLFEKALAIGSVTLGYMHPDVAGRYNNLGFAWQAKGEYDRAIVLFEKALAIDTFVFGNKHPSVAILYTNLGKSWDYKGEYDRAIALYEKALPIFVLAFGEQHPDVAIHFNYLGEAYHQKGEYDRAIALFEKALPIFVLAFGERHPYVAIQYNNLGSVWKDKGEYDRAIVLFEKALAIDSVTLGYMHPDMAGRYNNLGLAYRQKGEYDRAIALCEKALAIDTVALGKNHPEVARAYNNLGGAWEAKGEYDRAIALYEKARSIILLFHPPNHPNPKTVARNLSRVANNRGMKFFQEKKFGKALPYFQKALENAEQAEDWLLSITCLNNIGSMQKRLGKYAEGLASLEKGIARAKQINHDLDEQIKGLPAEQIQQPEVQAKIVEMRNLPLIRQMRYHSAGCLAGLSRKKEADELYQELLQEARETNDPRLLEDLKNDGVKE